MTHCLVVNKKRIVFKIIMLEIESISILSNAESGIDAWSIAAILPSAPFALAELLSPGLIQKLFER